MTLTGTHPLGGAGGGGGGTCPLFLLLSPPPPPLPLPLPPPLILSDPCDPIDYINHSTCHQAFTQPTVFNQPLIQRTPSCWPPWL